MILFIFIKLLLSLFNQSTCWAFSENALRQSANAAITNDSNNSRPQIIILNPENGARLMASEVLVAASLWDEQNDIDTSSIQIIVDDRDFTQMATITPEIVSLKLTGLNSGNHAIVLKCKDQKGNQADVPNWCFMVAVNEHHLKARAIFQVHTRVFMGNRIKHCE